MKLIFLRDPEAKAWKIGTNVIERAIPSYLQPRIIDNLWQIETKKGVFNAGKKDSCSIFRTNSRGLLKEPLASVCPYHPGDKVAVKETWAFNGSCKTEDYKSGRIVHLDYFIYKSDKQKSIGMFGCVKWHSPITMPSQAVRHFATITKVEAIERDGQWYWKITMEAES